jgi:hypothetical protein
VTIGQTWEIPADLTAGLLAIDTVDSGGLEARIEDVIDERAKVVISGIVDGAADGVPTHVTVEGQFTVAARSVAAVEAASDDEPVRHELHGRVTQVSAVIRERRQASHVAPGFEVEAKLLVTRTPIDAERPVADPTAEPAADSTPSSPVQGSPLRRSGAAAPGQVWYRDADGRLDLIHDTRWRRVEDDANGLVMRLVDRGALVGQCSISSLPRAPAEGRATRLVGHRGPAPFPLDSLRASGPGRQAGECDIHVRRVDAAAVCRCRPAPDRIAAAAVGPVIPATASSYGGASSGPRAAGTLKPVSPDFQGAVDAAPRSLG